MEVVRNITGVNFPVLTPNLKVNYLIIKWIFIVGLPCSNLFCSFIIRDLRQPPQQVQKKSQYLHQLLKHFRSQT
jgi:hypothetical protein